MPGYIHVLEGVRGPNLITLLKLLLGGAFRIQLGFVILILRIFYKGQEQASATSINLLGVLFLSLPFIPLLCPTTHLALG